MPDHGNTTTTIGELIGIFYKHFIELYGDEELASVATAAVKNLLGGDHAMAMSRKPSIMADAAWHILTSDASRSGNFFIDDEVLVGAGITDLDAYAFTPGSALMPDFFLDPTD